VILFMKLFTKKSLPAWIFAGWFVVFILVSSAAGEHTWAKAGVVLLIAPITIGMVVLMIMAYGEWIFNMIVLRRTNKTEFSNRIFISIGKMFTGFSALAAFGGFIWALEPGNQWVIWEVVKYGFCLAAVSIISFYSYIFYRRWKTKIAYRNFGQALRDAVAKVRGP
jgi:hypothetical protein